jgi:thiol-disulfide isomerase/thioredoxin
MTRKLHPTGCTERFFRITAPLLALLLSGCPAKTTQIEEPVKVVPEVPAAVKGPTELTYDGGFLKLDMAQATALSLDQNRAMLLYFYTPWCGPCKEYDKKVFPTPSFQDFAKTLVAIKIDAGNETESPVAKRYGVNSYPTMIVCKAGGEEIERFFGFKKGDVFVTKVQDYLGGRNTATDYRDRALADPNNLALAFTAGRELAVRKRGEEAIPFLERVWRADKEIATKDVPRAMLLQARTVYLDQLNEPDKALPILEELSKRFPAAYHGTEATYMIARIYLEKGQSEKAQEVLLTRVKIAPDVPIQYFRFGNFCLRYKFMHGDGIAKIEEGLKQHAETGYLWKVLADLRFRTKDYDGAVAAMEEAVKFAGGSLKTYEMLLQTYRKARERIKEGK